MYCEECETTWEYANIRCPDCRSRLVDPSEWVNRWCEKAPTVATKLFVGNDISERQETNVRKYYSIGNDRLLLLVDTTIFGSGKAGFAFGSRGIYWSDGRTKPLVENSLSWPEFAKRDLQLVDKQLVLGRGDIIDLVAVIGQSEREKIFHFLKKVHRTARAQERRRKRK